MDININMNANGGNNIWENHMSEAHKQCIMHKECKDCPLGWISTIAYKKWKYLLRNR